MPCPLRWSGSAPLNGRSRRSRTPPPSLPSAQETCANSDTADGRRPQTTTGWKLLCLEVWDPRVPRRHDLKGCSEPVAFVGGEVRAHRPAVGNILVAKTALVRTGIAGTMFISVLDNEPGPSPPGPVPSSPALPQAFFLPSIWEPCRRAQNSVEHHGTASLPGSAGWAPALEAPAAGIGATPRFDSVWFRQLNGGGRRPRLTGIQPLRYFARELAASADHVRQAALRAGLVPA